jgi:phospholipase/carboxylesterase
VAVPRVPRQIRGVGWSILTGARSLRESVNRRQFCAAALGTAMSAIAGCQASASGAQRARGRLTATPAAPTASIAHGLTPVEVRSEQLGNLYVPPDYATNTPVPLVIALHGAGGSPTGPMNLLRPYADTGGFIVLAIKSRDTTWDVLYGGYGPDVAAIDTALTFAFTRCNIHPRRVFVEGFSDGASYALGLGITNGDLFRGIIAFSPGFVPPSTATGEPQIFISHGTEDAILPIRQTSRMIVPGLRARNYAVEYREFEGPHRVPPDIGFGTGRVVQRAIAAAWLSDPVQGAYCLAYRPRKGAIFSPAGRSGFGPLVVGSTQVAMNRRFRAQLGFSLVGGRT